MSQKYESTRTAFFTGITIGILICAALMGMMRIAKADAGIDLGGKLTRMDEARVWCRSKRDSSLTYYIIKDGTRVVFAAECNQFLDKDITWMCIGS